MDKFSQRSEAKEWMDDLQCSGRELDQTIRELKTINRLLGGNSVTTSGLDYLMRQRPQEQYAIADLGCGGGDMAIWIKKWSLQKGHDCKVTGIDANPNIIALARERCRAAGMEVDFNVANVFDPGFLQQGTDLITCTLFTHHFTNEELISLIGNLKQSGSIGIVINDLHRHFLAYYSIMGLTSLFSRSAMVKNDAPLSVLRAFSRNDWEHILKAANVEKFKISWNWAFRWQVICWF
ncbi:Methyltransferase domain-containing protein [Cyclobacterium lianum]|uniref:Methyltransferase domain-containing protein n=2 Tax=Cyclobacterium lianum TaxID=388280 RepID=A0A1M7I6F0_9BACT|nr:Methyltransferase domain-containing protein [Cyclobacterium lianum]